MAKVSYHDSVNDVQDPRFWGQGPFARREWFALLENAGTKPLVVIADDGGDCVCLALTQGPRGLESLTNWYAFQWEPHASMTVSEGPWTQIARDLATKAGRIDFTKLPVESNWADLLTDSFRAAGWLVFAEPCDVNHVLRVDGRSYAQYLADRPGPLRTTLKRKAKRVAVRLSERFDTADWNAYEEIYADSWKPEEGDPALLRAFARGESDAGRYRFAIAHYQGEAVAAQFWTVDGGTAYIHKLAHRENAASLSPGTTLTAALLARVIDVDRVTMVDFGTGDDRYKADWMEQTRTRWRIVCLRPLVPRNWLSMARHAAKLVSRRPAG